MACLGVLRYGKARLGKAGQGSFKTRNFSFRKRILKLGKSKVL